MWHKGGIPNLSWWQSHSGTSISKVALQGMAYIGSNYAHNWRYQYNPPKSVITIFSLHRVLENIIFRMCGTECVTIVKSTVHLGSFLSTNEDDYTYFIDRIE